MRITVASGKGGTGKTTVVSSLALASQINYDLFDFDVESPDLSNFIARRVIREQDVVVPVPQVDISKCTLCRACLDCRFNAIALIKEQILIFPDICRHCGFCSMICPVNAISESNYKIGNVIKSEGDSREMFSGKLKVGEHHPDWIIKELNKTATKSNMILIDSSPGSGREILLSVKDSDYIILVTEPTKFALKDLELLLNKIRYLNKPMGVIINKSSNSDKIINDFCQRNNLRILGRIPYSMKIAELNSKGIPFISEFPEYYKKFREILEKIRREVGDV